MKRFLVLISLLIFSASVAQNIEENLLLHYPFDGSSEDVSGNEYHALENEVIYVDDRHGNPESAIYFNGVNSYINFPNVSELKPDLPLSISFWIKYDSNLYTDREVFNTSFEEDISSGVFFNSTQSTGNYSISFGDGSNNYTVNTRRTYTSNSSVETGQWTNIIAIIESSNSMKLYVNCREMGGIYSGNGGPLYYSNTSGSLGRHDRELGAPANYFKGSIDDFRYWDKVLSNSEIEFVCDSSLNIETFTLESQIKLFPNPAYDFFEIASPISFDQIEIYDSNGRLVLKDVYNEKQNISGFKSGVYFVSLVSDELVIRKKLIIK